MDMEDNEQLLREFFAEASQQQIADGGFSRRVMQHLPARINWMTRLWNIFCIAVFVVLFVVLDGWGQLANHFRLMLQALDGTTFSINPVMMATVLFGLLFVGVGEVIWSESVRR
ncbi:MAG: DUF5056 domain-containing protein [Prevotella sp.]|nr:DUF5056 domain-containing protein [Prevotella sp.]